MPFNDRSTPISLLLTRRSAKARDLAAPGPDAGQLELMLKAATRVPDHGKLAPWRFVIVTDRQRFESAALAAAEEDHPGLGDGERARLAAFAHEAPLLIAALHVPVEGPIPLWEQKLSAGAAIQNLLMAAHALGFGACWLTPAPLTGPAMARALGHPHGRVFGYIFIGTLPERLDERPRPGLAEVVSHF
jgi:nitroreductase